MPNSLIHFFKEDSPCSCLTIAVKSVLDPHREDDMEAIYEVAKTQLKLIRWEIRSTEATGLGEWNVAFEKAIPRLYITETKLVTAGQVFAAIASLVGVSKLHGDSRFADSLQVGRLARGPTNVRQAALTACGSGAAISSIAAKDLDRLLGWYKRAAVWWGNGRSRQREQDLEMKPASAASDSEEIFRCNMDLMARDIEPDNVRALEAYEILNDGLWSHRPLARVIAC